MKFCFYIFLVFCYSLFADPLAWLVIKKDERHSGYFLKADTNKLLLRAKISDGNFQHDTITTFLYSEIDTFMYYNFSLSKVFITKPINEEKVNKIMAQRNREVDSVQKIADLSNEEKKKHELSLDKSIESSVIRNNGALNQLPEMIFIKQKDPLNAALCGLIVPGGANLYSENYIAAIILGAIEITGIITISTANQSNVQIRNDTKTIGILIWSVGGLIDIYSGMISANIFKGH
jgi:hypothetical protein